MAWFALAVGLLSLGWQVYTWFRSRRTDLAVKLTIFLGLERLLAPASLNIINHSTHDVRPVAIELRLEDGTKKFLGSTAFPKLQHLFDPIKAHDGVFGLFSSDDWKLLNLPGGSKVRVHVRLSTDETFESSIATVPEPPPEGGGPMRRRLDN